MLQEAAVPEQAEKDTEFRHILDDGREFRASSRTEAIASCPFLSKLPVEQANILLELTATPVVREQEPVSEDATVTTNKYKFTEKDDRQKHVFKPTEVASPKQEIFAEPETLPNIATKTDQLAEIEVKLTETRQQVQELFAETTPSQRDLEPATVHVLSVQAKLEHDFQLLSMQQSQHIESATLSHERPEIVSIELPEMQLPLQATPVERLKAEELPDETTVSPRLDEPPNVSQVAKPALAVVEETIKMQFEASVTGKRVETDEPLERYDEQDNPSTVVPEQTDIATDDFFTGVIETGDVEEGMEIAPGITEFTARLNMLFAEQEPMPEPETPTYVLPDLIYETSAESADFIQEDETIDGFFVPLVPEGRREDILNKTLTEAALLPVSTEVVERLQAFIAELKSTPDEVPELTDQIVEDIITILTHLGHEEPHKALVAYAQNHSLAELFEELAQVLPELTKLIDYQQHLLTTLARASARSGRRLHLAEVLTRLLFKTGKQVAAGAA